jgi:hypothetical protein
LDFLLTNEHEGKRRKKTRERKKYRTIKQESNITFARRFDLVEEISETRREERGSVVFFLGFFFPSLFFVFLMLVTHIDGEAKSLSNYFPIRQKY